MGTKYSPSKFDCYANAGYYESLFVLLARDRMAPYLVNIWALCREGRNVAATNMLQLMLEELCDTPIAPNDFSKAIKARQCAESMALWYANNRKNK